MVDVVVLGHIINEKIIFPDRDIFPVLGSPVAYSSVCMASLGLDVGIVTKIGMDFPEELLSVFKETKVDTEGVRKNRNSTNNELIYDFNGNKKVNFLTKAEEINFKDMPEKYLEAKIFSISPMDYEVSLNTIKNISNLGKVMVVDIGGYGGGTSSSHPSMKNGQEIKEICPYFDIVKGSIEDYSHVFGFGADEVFISNKILEWGSSISIITLGSRGSYIKTRDDEKYIPIYPEEKYVDQTGAGDCYLAGFLASYLRDRDPFVAGYFGSAVTSYIIERSGGVITDRMPVMEEAIKRVNSLIKL